MPLELIRNDITHMDTDAIVNAANAHLLQGGGVCGAIFAAAGAEKLTRACQAIGGCAPGQAVLTPGFALPARYIIHTVGPVWQGGGAGEAQQLASCYRQSLRLAQRYGCRSVAFPLISAGHFGYPNAQAVSVAFSAIRAYLMEEEDLNVYLVLYDRDALSVSQELLGRVQSFIDDHYVDAHPDCSPRYSNLPKIRRKSSLPAAPSPEPLCCPNCGKRIPEGAAFCPDCGSEVALRFCTVEEAYCKAQASPDEEPLKIPLEPEDISEKATKPMPCPAQAKEPDAVCAPKEASRPKKRRFLEELPFHSAAFLKPDAVRAPKEVSRPKEQRSLEELLFHMDDSFSRMLLRMIDERGMTDVEVYKRANLDRKLFSKVRKEGYTPSRQTAVALAIALRLNLDETKDLLSRAGYALSRSSRFDVIIEYFITEEIYDIDEINQALFFFDQKLLGA